MTINNVTFKASNINIELGKGSTTQFKIGDSDVRNLAGFPSGSFKASDLRGKSAITIVAVNVQSLGSGFNIGTCTLTIYANGQYEANGSGTGDFDFPLSPYVNPTSGSNQVSYKIVNYSGQATSGTLVANTLYSANTDRYLTLTSPYRSYANCSFSIEWYINGVLKKTTSVFLEAETTYGGGGGGL